MSKYTGDTGGDGDVDVPTAFGARSFSIWNATTLANVTTATSVFDSGAQMEQFFATYFPLYFNCSRDNNTLDNRSDDAGPEPENVTLLSLGSKTYAAIGIERTGGFFLYDITTPASASRAAYYTGRHFTQTPGQGQGGDLAPEGMVVINAADSPTGTALLVVGNETSGTVAIHSIIAGPSVAGGNAAPTISVIADQTVSKNGDTGPLSFSIADPDSALANLVVSIATSNGTYLPVGNLLLGGAGYGRSVTAIPAAALTGSATVTVTVSDGIASASETFVVNTPADSVAATTAANDDDDSSGCGVGGSGMILIMGTLAFLGLRRRRD